MRFLFKALFLISFGFACLALPQRSMAQESSFNWDFLDIEKQEEGINYRKVFEQLPEDIRTELMNETVQEYEKCSLKGIYSHFHDCQCVAVKYLDERIKRGPEVASELIMMDIQTQCPDAASIAGYQYVQCEDLFAFDVIGNLDKFCACYANNIAKAYTKKPSSHSTYVTMLAANAMNECGYGEEKLKYELKNRSPYK